MNILFAEGDPNQITQAMNKVRTITCFLIIVIQLLMTGNLYPAQILGTCAPDIHSVLIEQHVCQVLEDAPREAVASGQNEDLKPIDFEDLPQAIRNKAKKEFPDQPLIAAEISKEEGEWIYHVMFEVEGAEAGLKIDTQGNILDRWHFKEEAQREESFPPTYVDIPYGPYERNVLDLWLAKSELPTPILICIHGGGFSGGDKRGFRGEDEILGAMLESGISVAAINYRLTEGGKNPFPIPMRDGARAIQYLRHHAKKYNLDKKRFAATGGSAGGCMLMWLGFHPDLAVEDHVDPVLRESSRLQVLAPTGGQSTLHIPTLEKWFEVSSLRPHPAYGPLFGLTGDGPYPLTDSFKADMWQASPITYLSDNDPPTYLRYNDEKVRVNEKSAPGVWVHHPVMGIKLKEAMESLGLECHVEYPGGEPIKKYTSQINFIIQQLTAKED